MKILLSILLSIALFLSACKKAEKENLFNPNNSAIMFVNAKGGLYLREKPDQSSKKITLIPDASKVEVIEQQIKEVTILGKNGRWARARYSGKEGWVFDGFLVESNETQSNPSASSNNEIEEMKNIENSLTGEKKSLYSEILKQYTEAIELTKKSPQEGSKKYKSIYDSYEKYREKIEKRDEANDDMSFAYSISHIFFRSCINYMEIKYCDDKSKNGKKFKSREEAVSWIQKGITEKSSVLLTEGSGCLLETTCYACDAGSVMVPAKSFFDLALKKGSFDPKNSEDTGIPELVNFGNTSFVLLEDNEHEWSYNHVPLQDFHDQLESCGSPGMF